ncbi:MAG: efflux RND transporter periplasmic adaptor subunit [Planctomycetes bacterium]|nr:efflux RND transporter periplasmic adaptor subunit [Planctomycetota bacterium]
MTNRFTIRYGQAILSVILLATLIVGCNRPTQNPELDSSQAKPQAKTVSVGVVREKLLKKTVELPATIESDETAMLMPRVEAYVDKVLVDIGDEVQAGQVLVELQAPELRQAVEESQAMIWQIRASEQVLLAELAAARTQLDVVRAKQTLKESQRDRRARLVSSGAVSRDLLEEAEADLQATSATLAKYENAVQVVEARLAQSESELAVGKAKLRQAETLVSYLEIKAPVAGVVAERNVDPGNLVRPANASSSMKPLLVVAKVDKLRAIVHATTDVAGQLVVGQAVRFSADDLPGKAFEGQLSRMAGTYNRKTRMMQAEVDLDNAPDPTTGLRPLRAGSYGSLTIVLQAATLPVVPKSALRMRGDRASVVVVRNGACMVTPVKIAFASGKLVAIAEGIVAGDQVVAEPNGIKDEQVLKDSEIKIVGW